MKIKIILSAFFQIRNISILLMLIGLSFVLNAIGIVPYASIVLPTACIGIILMLMAQTLHSKSFHETYNRRKKIRHIRELNHRSSKLANEAKNHVNSVYFNKLRKVMEDKKEIVDSFLRGEHSFMKERIVEQTLNLVLSYESLLINFCKRSRDVAGNDLSDIANRINANVRKLSFNRDSAACEDLRKVIEMDEELIESMKEEKKELERIQTKLDYMENMVHMFKQQILSRIESEDMLEKIETVVNETSALDSVLQERRKKHKA